jgi:hypothetical protein
MCWFDSQGRLLPTGHRIVEEERQRADQERQRAERQRADRLAAQLRAWASIPSKPNQNVLAAD